MGALGLRFRVFQSHNHPTSLLFVHPLSLSLHYKLLGATSAYTLSPVLVYVVLPWILALGWLYHTRDIVFITWCSYVCPQESAFTAQVRITCRCHVTLTRKLRTNDLECDETRRQIRTRRQYTLGFKTKQPGQA